MTSTSPVATTPAVGSPQQNSFHPSWSAADNSASAPVFVKNRYGREDMLALMGDAAGHPAPEGLRDCPFYVEEALQPIVCYPLSDLEQRLQQNINSSKAMASLSHAERANIATGAAYSGSTDGGTACQKASTGGWTSVKQWNRNHPNTGSARGTSFSRVYGSSGRNTTRGDGTNISQDHSQLNSFGQRFATRGRGTLASARGGTVSGTTFNSRAQGLYDPRDPKGDTASSISEVPQESLRKNESGLMPEWMEDGEDQDKGESGDDTISATGSFDEHGRFRKKHHGPLDPSEEKTPGVNRDRCEKQQTTNVENYSIVSSIEKNGASQQMSGDPNLSSAQTHVLNSDAATSHGYSNVLSQAEAVGYHPSVPSQPSVGTVPTVVPNSIHQNASQFFYLDPTKQERGPFEKMQMDSWYKRGYFTEALEVRRHPEAKYRTLGELVQLNGQLTPFDFKDDVSCQPSVTPVFSNPAPPFATLFASGTGTMWSELSNPSSMIYNQASYDHIAVERKRIGDEQRRILEEQAKMREYQEHLIREMQKQREEQEKQLLEQKLALMKHQEEIERRERELKESAEETKARLEMERLALAEKARQLEEERVAKIQEKMERQRKVEETLKRQHEVEKERRANECAEEEARRLAAANAEKIRIQQAELHRKQRIAEDSVRKSTVAQSSSLNEKGKSQDSAKTFEIEEVWQPAPKPSQTTVQSTEQSSVASPQTLRSSSTKVAPWLSASSIAPMKEKSLKEIQEEEERLLRAEQTQQARLRKEAAKRALGMCEDNTAFIDWVVQRLKQLSSTVEADVLAMFIEGIENPDEVEDYVMGYLGDSKTVKEFVREFLQKRSDFRNRGQHAVKDDLSCARGAPVSGNGSGFSVVQGRKKKNKGARLIVDGSCLGFRATSDPNRVNQGEIETVALSPGQKR
ncbi:unnamed protein product [Angiostrongylus costaricensis]|uniref:GYF domain-containing protein n=1 Tax=Angiostrongylus costaricensis TaxID=334426 RepID=A0A158PDX3_ANGCS|nr:unnamed protein product [Angiostrongylus costaricensis]